MKKLNKEDVDLQSIATGISQEDIKRESELFDKIQQLVNKTIKELKDITADPNLKRVAQFALINAYIFILMERLNPESKAKILDTLNNAKEIKKNSKELETTIEKLKST